jgi:hypothetical protein
MVDYATYSDEYLYSPRYEQLLILVPGVAITTRRTKEFLQRTENCSTWSNFEIAAAASLCGITNFR